MRFAIAPRLFMINVEIIFIEQTLFFQKHLRLPDHATVSEALQASGILSMYPHVQQYSMGIFSKPATLETLLTEGDRLEIYTPLLCDPKTRRRMRATR